MRWCERAPRVRALAAGLITVCLVGISAAQQPRPPAAAAARRRIVTPGIEEIVATARVAPATWRYTFEQPADDWIRPAFEDGAWKAGRAGFGTDGTPGIVVNTRWATRDLWLRREVELPASGFDPAALQLFIFHDEDVEVYLNGVLAARRGGFVSDYEAVEVRPEARALLKPGARVVVAVHCRQNGGGQGVDVGFAILSQELIATQRRNAYRAFAMSTPGDAGAGSRLFSDAQRLGCVKCHTTDGTSGRAGPDLHAIGDKFPRAEMIDAVLNPSAQIAVGYGTTIVNTKAGETLVGVLKDVADDHLSLMSGDGKLHRIAAADMRSRGSQRSSLMPEGLEAGLSQRQFADLIEYLVSLRLPAVADAGRQGMPSEIPQLSRPVRLVPIHRAEDRFEHPCWVGEVPGEPGTFLVCEHQTGWVWRLAGSGGGQTKAPWGNFRSEVRPGPAIGLLGLAFHPRFLENRKYYVQHQFAVDGRIYARVSEKIAASDLRSDSGRPSRTIAEFPCSTDVHSGGGIEFGPDGYLYIGMGDTGPQGDPQGHAQDLRSLLGKMLRIDVDHEEAGKAYAVPADNPFRSRAGARPEIWAFGFREPWRFSFDPLTGDLWVGDVGQDRIEEVGIARAGENHGWNVYEGFDLFSNRYRADGMIGVPPVFAYNRRLGNSVTGGYVYRPAPQSPFYGVYVCGDFTSKRVWGLKQQDRKLTSIWELCRSPESIASFGRDEAGNLYLVGYEGTIFRIDFGPAVAPPGSAGGATGT